MKKTAKTLLVSIVLIGGVCVWLIRGALDPFNDKPFDKVRWLQGVELRTSMAKDVIDQIIEDRMSRNEVIGLLGEPNEIRKGQDSGENELAGVETLTYYLGSSGATGLLGMDDAFVYIHLGGEQQVVHKEINGY